ncbi:MAG: sulfatase [Candidatus Hydrogenedens sp.]
MYISLIIYFCVFAQNAGNTTCCPNILIISVDTLRANHLSCYGYEYLTSPNIDKLAQEGVVFDNCITEVPLTCPSFSAMFTSKFPRTIGVTRNGLGISKGEITITELFKEKGYFTFCVQSNWTLKAKLSGLNKGFDVYDDDFHVKRWGIFSPERIADEVTRKSIDILNKLPENKPFFGWVHYSDPHAPYHFHKEYNVHREKKEKISDKKYNKVKSYDSEIRFTDEQIGVLLKHIPENTTIVFVADHGESLYEHNYLGHGRKLYQNEVRIPFIIVSSKIKARRIDIPVRGIDIGPTILGIAGIHKTKSMLGKDVLNENINKERVRVIETYGGAVPKIPILRSLMKKSGPIMQSVIVENWKLIVKNDRKELYNIAEDPEELNNIGKKYPEKVLELQKVIKKWTENTPINTRKDEQKLSEEDLEVLRSMGYLQ